MRTCTWFFGLYFSSRFFKKNCGGFFEPTNTSVAFYISYSFNPTGLLKFFPFWLGFIRVVRKKWGKFPLKNAFFQFSSPLSCIRGEKKPSYFDVGAIFDPKKCPSEYCVLDVDFCSSRLAYPILKSSKAFFVVQDPGSLFSGSLPSTWIDFLCAKNTPKKSLNFDFWVSTKILSFEANFDPNKSCP